MLNHFVILLPLQKHEPCLMKIYFLWAVWNCNKAWPRHSIMTTLICPQGQGFKETHRYDKHSGEKPLRSFAKQNVVEQVVVQETIELPERELVQQYEVFSIFEQRLLRGTLFLNLTFMYWRRDSIYQKVIVIIFIKSFDKFMSIRSIAYRMYFLYFTHDLREKENNPLNCTFKLSDAWKKVWLWRWWQIEIADLAIYMSW